MVAVAFFRDAAVKGTENPPRGLVGFSTVLCVVTVVAVACWYLFELAVLLMFQAAFCCW